MYVKERSKVASVAQLRGQSRKRNARVSTGQINEVSASTACETTGGVAPSTNTGSPSRTSSQMAHSEAERELKSVYRLMPCRHAVSCEAGG